MFRILCALAVVWAIASPCSAQVRIKDMTDIAGARANQLIGFGLIVGLDQTGSRSTFTQQVAVDMLQRQGVAAQIFSQSPAQGIIASTSMSAVEVIAEIGPFARKGSRIDVIVSALDDAKSLQGGTLLMTPLRGADGDVYAVAQGPLSIGGFSVTAQAAGGIQKNHLNVGRIPNGGIVEKEAPGEVMHQGRATLLLKDPDFNTARLVAKIINERFAGVALAIDAGSVALCPPVDPVRTALQFIAEIGLLEVHPDIPARLVINERTGTVVAGEHVAISTTAVSHGNLYIGVSVSQTISQPAPFSGGTTVTAPQVSVSAAEGRQRLIVLPPSATVSEVARALNSLGVTPRDLIAIFQALKQAGALHAELIII